MATKLLPAVVLVVAVLAPSTVSILQPTTVIKNCKEEAIEHFDPSRLCGKTFYIQYTSSNAANIDCAFVAVQCSDGDVHFNTYVIRNNALNLTLTSTISQIKSVNQGVLLRKFFNTVSDIKELIVYIKSYTEFQPDEQGNINIKFSYVMCRPDTGEVVNKIVVSDFKGDYWDELRNLLVTYEDVGISNIPNTCDADDYINN